MDLSTPLVAFASLNGIGYFMMFLMLMIEGPIVNFVSSFASSLGYFNVFLVLPLAILANITADMIYYLMGRYAGKSKFVKKYMTRSMSHEKMEKTKFFLKKNPGKTIVAIKLTPFVPLAGIILIGMAEVPLKKFLSFSMWVDIIMCLVITMLGFYSGALFSMIFRYFEYGLYGLGLLVVLTLLFWIFIKYILKKISKRVEDI
jgi:membrane-associated protein